MIHVLAVPCRVCMVLVLASLAVLAGCSSTELPTLPTTGNYGTQTTDPSKYNYIIGPGDSVQIFVWRNPEVSQSVTVRPDGKITTPLVEDLQDAMEAARIPFSTQNQLLALLAPMHRDIVTQR